MSLTLASAISNFGIKVKAKLASPAIEGAPEDQLRGPLESLFEDFAELCGLQRHSVRLIGETTLGDLKTRPDYAVTVDNALVGFIEVKAPRKGADPRKLEDPHDKAQWAKLKALPNLLYTSGGGFSLWHDGEIGEKSSRSTAISKRPARCCEQPARSPRQTMPADRRGQPRASSRGRHPFAPFSDRRRRGQHERSRSARSFRGAPA